MEQNRKKYEEAEFAFIALEADDIVCTSGKKTTSTPKSQIQNPEIIEDWDITTN